MPTPPLITKTFDWHVLSIEQSTYFNVDCESLLDLE